MCANTNPFPLDRWGAVQDHYLPGALGSGPRISKWGMDRGHGAEWTAVAGPCVLHVGPLSGAAWCPVRAESGLRVLTRP